MLHLPILRWGRPYTSVERTVVPHFRTREPFVEISQANVGLIRRDLLKQADARATLTRLSIHELTTLARAAASQFMTADLPLGENAVQSPQDYIEQVSATTGLPWASVRRNMAKVHGVLNRVDEVLGGLTRGLNLSVLDEGMHDSGGHLFSFFPRADSLGVVLPSNSPGVHSLWAPATVLKMPLVLKPGSAEPWTPLRIVSAWIKAGAPAEAFGYYPTDHAGGAEILRSCDRGMVFGDVSVTKRWARDPRVEVHGPGWSKVVIGPDKADEWESCLDLIVESVSNNGGRSCVNASGVWVTRHGDAIAEALAERLAQVVPRASEDDAAVLSPFADPHTATRISRTVDEDLVGRSADGDFGTDARDVSASVHGGSRVVEAHGGTYLLPTVIRCGPDHALANREFLFPFVSVVEVPAEELPARLGPSLVVSCVSDDPAFRSRFLRSPHIERLNFGAIPTTQIGWDQPHEGNLFDHLYARRAIQRLA